MKILILGSWRKQKAIQFKQEAEKIGNLLAKRGHTLISGGGTGISELIVNAYKLNKGKKYIAYFPSKEDMKRVGEEKGPQPDETVETHLDYPSRNIQMIKDCDGVIALHGGLGALAEIIHAIKDYNKKVSLIDKGDLALWIKTIIELKETVFLTSDIKKAIEYLEK